MFTEFGRVGRDAVVRYTPGGTAVANIALAYNYGRKGDDGQKPTQWIEIAVWGKQAEALAQYLTKGKQVYVSVKDLHVETFTKNDGTPSYKLVGDLVGIKFASDGQGQQQEQANNQYGAAMQPNTNQPALSPQQYLQQQQQQQPQNNFGDIDDSVPF